MTNPLCITENDMSLCTGCMVCMDTCPTKAIKEGFTKDGFRIPIVCKDKCIKCSKCLNVCSLCSDKKEFSPIVIYRMAAKDNYVRMMCSSGGIFAILSEKMIKSGGVVIGAVFDAECKDVHHATSDEFGLEELYRSKYVQSNMIGIYKKTERILQEGRNILFCGTPCQVRALRKFLSGKRYSGNLITVDFMCHGVPSTMEFKDFVSEREKKEKSQVINVTFREKDDGWRKQSIKVYHKNGKIWKKTSNYYYYYYMFLNNYSLRDSCYSCEEYSTHTSDITLADDWSGSENDDIGTSLVFVNTPIGQNAIQKVMDEVAYTDVTERTMSNISIYSHFEYDYNKKKQWKDILETGGYQKVKSILFYKVSTIPLIKYKLRIQVSKLKRFLKKSMISRQ